MLKYSQEWCIENINNKDWQVRFDVALNIDISYLPQMMNDEHWFVRCQVAQRIDKKNALLMSAIDEDAAARIFAWNNAMGMATKI